MDIFKIIQFEAAHRLPNVDEDNKCFRLHGHSFKVEVHVTGTVDEHKGWVMDFADIRKAFDPVFETLDHSYLNDVPGLENPTSENIARWMWKKLKPSLHRLSKIVIYETCTSGCTYLGEDE